MCPQKFWLGRGKKWHAWGQVKALEERRGRRALLLHRDDILLGHGRVGKASQAWGVGLGIGRHIRHKVGAERQPSGEEKGRGHGCHAVLLPGHRQLKGRLEGLGQGMLQEERGSQCVLLRREAWEGMAQGRHGPAGPAAEGKGKGVCTG